MPELAGYVDIVVTKEGPIGQIKQVLAENVTAFRFFMIFYHNDDDKCMMPSGSQVLEVTRS